MNVSFSLNVWLEPLLVLAAGGAVIVCLAALLARAARTAAGRRLAWQTATLGLVGLILGEMSGLGGGASDWLVQMRRSLPEPAATPTAAETLVSARTEPVVSKLVAVEPPPQLAAGPQADVEATTWWPGLLWLLGLLVVTGRVCLARALLFVFRRRHRPTRDAALAERVHFVADRLGMRRRVVVLQADGLLGPVAFGILRPTIALPGQFTSAFTSAQQEAILAHELTHLAAGDPAWQLLGDLVAAVLWWHPLAWWARQQLRLACEMAADEASLVVTDGPAVLAACLVDLGGVLAGRHSPGWLRMAGSGFRSGLGRRVERLLHLGGTNWRPVGMRRSLVTLGFAPVALLAAAILCTAWARAWAFGEGDEPMRPVWRRSLAALVLMGALGTETPSARTDEPPKAPRGTGTEKDLQRLIEVRVTLDRDLEQLKKTAAQQLTQQMQKAPSEQALEKIQDQLEAVRAQMAQLETMRAQLEEQIHAVKQREKESETTPHIKVFRLRHLRPQEMQVVLSQFLATQVSAGNGAGAGPGGAMGSGGVWRTPIMAGAPGTMPGAGLGPAGGGSGGMMGGMSPVVLASRSPWSIAMDERTRSVIVRGTTQELQIVAELVAALDVPDGKGVGQVKGFRIFHLRHADALELERILLQLNIHATIISAQRAGVLLVSAPDSSLKEIGEVIEAVDVEQKPAAKSDSVKETKP